jgi:ketosteroid isomerase-like protein
MRYTRACYGIILVQWLVSSADSFVPNQKALLQRSRTEQSYQSRSTQAPFATTKSILDSLKSFLPSGPTGSLSPSQPESLRSNIAVQFFEFLNDGNLDAALELFAEDHVVEWDDCAFYNPCVGRTAIERRLRLQSEITAFQQQAIRVDRVAVDTSRNTIGVLFHREQIQSNGSDDIIIPNSRSCAMFELDNSNNPRIRRVCVVAEPAIRGGEAGLKILSKASSIMDATGYNPEAMQQQQQTKRQGTATMTTSASSSAGFLSPPEQYFDAWNRRDMIAAVNVFADDMKYEDTAFPEPFVGKAKLQEHLNKCSNAFPASFQIVVDAVAVDKAACAATVEWHFENGKGEALPFTQGCSYYKLDTKGERILEGIDFIEPAVFKPSGLALFLQSLTTKLSQEPIRWIPVLSWVAYMYIVFISDGILPGANALQLEARTWEEVFNLSLNFFLVSPLLHLPFSPSVHPMLEAVFNLLLSWAAMFAGFLCDDRPNKPNVLPMIPMVAGMQFLTSAFLLPYLAVRSSEPRNTDSSIMVVKEDLPVAAQLVGESPILGGLMGFVGTGSILWFFLGRTTEYGADLAVRFASFLDLLSIDRVGSSFLVDLAIFALFQGWLVEDDLKRRGVRSGDLRILESAAKYIPFFGMAAYLILRPRIPERVSGGTSQEA